MTIEVNVDISEIEKKQSNIRSYLPEAMGRATQRALNDIGQAVVSRATLAFRTPQMRPSPWAPRKPLKRDDGHPLLIKSGSLRQSIKYRVVGSDTVMVGSDKEYAKYHQHGTKRMPARPFFPVDSYGNLLPEIKRKIEGKVRKSFVEEISAKL